MTDHKGLPVLVFPSRETWESWLAEHGTTSRGIWLKLAKKTSDVAERTKLYEEAQVVFKKEAPWATIDHSTEFVPMNAKVSGYVQDPVGVHRFDGVDIAE